jgi:hypothetical protein
MHIDPDTVAMRRLAKSRAVALREKLLTTVCEGLMDERVIGVDFLTWLFLVAQSSEKVRAAGSASREDVLELTLMFVVACKLQLEHWDWATLTRFVKVGSADKTSMRVGSWGECCAEYSRTMESLFLVRDAAEFAGRALHVTIYLHRCVAELLAAATKLSSNDGA